MMKLYNLSESKYWETWDNGDGSHIVHWGTLGDEGESKTVRRSLFRKPKTAVQKEAEAMRQQGFVPIDIEDHAVLLIEYTVDDFGAKEDLEKRYALQDRMDQTLGWTGLGNCDGGSIGSGTMEVCCYVVDFDVAKAVIEKDLEGSEFADYTRIYDEAAH